MTSCAIIRKHPGRTAELLGMIKGLKHLAWIAAGHHERYDGRGYPLGLAEEDIPHGARILAIADAFDAMTSTGHTSGTGLSGKRVR